MGGTDVTSVATVPAQQRSVGYVRRSARRCRRRSRRRRSGDRRGVRRRRCPTSSTSSPTATGSGRGCGGPGHGADASTADGRAHGAQPVVPPLGGRHADAAMGRCAGGDAVRRARHAQDHAGSARPREVRRALWRWRQPPHGAFGRRARQGQPCAGGWRRGRGVRRRATPRCERSRSRSRSTRWTGCASPSTPASTPCCSTTSRSTRCARRWRSATNPAAAVVLEASGGLTLEVARQVGETGVDYVAVGELTHSARILDLGLDLNAVT